MLREARNWAIVLAGYALAGGIVSLAGWVLDLPPLTDWDASGVSIQPNTTLAVILASSSLLLLQFGRKRAAGILGAIVAAIGGATLFEWLSGVSLGIDALLLFGRTWGRVGVIFPGRMGPPGATSWTLIGIAILLASRGAKQRAAVPALATVTLGIALLSAIGYAYGASALYTMPRLTVIAVQTSTFIFALSIALLLSVPERSPVRRLMDESVAGALMRRAVPIAVIVPVVLGFLKLAGQEFDLYDLQFGTALRTVAEIVLLIALLGWTAGVLSRQVQRTDDQKRESRAHEQRLAGLLGSMNDAFMTLDGDWRFTFVNDEAVGLLRLTRPELLGRSIWETLPAARDTETYAKLHEAMRDRGSVEYDFYFEPWERWFYGKAYPMGDGGLALFFRDVTERHKVDESLRVSQLRLQADLVAMTRLQSVSTQLVQAGDLATLLREILTAATDLTATDKGNIQIYDDEGDRLRILVHQGLGPAFLERYAEEEAAAVCGMAARNLERVVVADVANDPRLAPCPDDRKTLLDDGIHAVQSTPLVSRDGKLLGVLNTHFGVPHTPPEHQLRYVDLLARMAADVIERSRVEQMLQSARSQAERASELKDEFLATLSHELRTPLNAILGWVRVLEKRRSDAALTNEGIEVIARNAKAQADLIADLLDMNRIMSGKIRLDVAEVDLPNVIAEAIETIRPAAESKRIAVQSVVSPLAEPVRADATRIRQVMWNLLSNAVKFTPHDGRIQVMLMKSESYAEIVVSDSGAGIDPRFLPHVFDRFRQGDASTTRAHGGLGLGLAIVKQLVELHGGTVRADSGGEGLGATFTVRLPLALMRLPARAPSEGKGMASPRLLEDVDLEGITVLAVEDQADARNLLKIVLERSGARVITAGSVDEALRVLERSRPALILCDIGMPGKDGYDFIAELRRRNDDTPALAVTAFARTEDKIRALRAGYHGHIAKPIEPAELLTTVAVFARASKH